MRFLDGDLRTRRAMAGTGPEAGPEAESEVNPEAESEVNLRYN